MNDLEPLLRDETPEEEERKTSYLELFFDLVFVFAITQVTSLILEDTSPAGFARSALLLALVWWAWSAYAWLTDAIDIESLVARLIVLGAMATAFSWRSRCPTPTKTKASGSRSRTSSFASSVLPSTSGVYAEIRASSRRRSCSHRGSRSQPSWLSWVAFSTATAGRTSGSHRW
jgi:hypothetical protein